MAKRTAKKNKDVQGKKKAPANQKIEEKQINQFEKEIAEDFASFKDQTNLGENEDFEAELNNHGESSLQDLGELEDALKDDDEIEKEKEENKNVDSFFDNMGIEEEKEQTSQEILEEFLKTNFAPKPKYQIDDSDLSVVEGKQDAQEIITTENEKVYTNGDSNTPTGEEENKEEISNNDVTDNPYTVKDNSKEKIEEWDVNLEQMLKEDQDSVFQDQEKTTYVNTPMGDEQTMGEKNVNESFENPYEANVNPYAKKDFDIREMMQQDNENQRPKDSVYVNGDNYNLSTYNNNNLSEMGFVELTSRVSTQYERAMNRSNYDRSSVENFEKMAADYNTLRGIHASRNFFVRVWQFFTGNKENRALGAMREKILSITTLNKDLCDKYLDGKTTIEAIRADKDVNEMTLDMTGNSFIEDFEIIEKDQDPSTIIIGDVDLEKTDNSKTLLDLTTEIEYIGTFSDVLSKESQNDSAEIEHARSFSEGLEDKQNDNIDLNKTV